MNKIFFRQNTHELTLKVLTIKPFKTDKSLTQITRYEKAIDGRAPADFR